MPAKLFEGNPYGFASIYAYDDNGPVEVALHGYDNNVGATGSVVNIHGGDGFTTVNIGLNNTLGIALGGYGNSVTTTFTAKASIDAGSGGAQIIALISQSYDIRAGGYLNTIHESGGTGTINVGGGASTVTVQYGSGTVTLAGSNNAVTVGQGAYTVDAGATATVNTTTVGNSTLTAEGYGNQFFLTGSQPVEGGPYDVVNAGAGSASVTLSGGDALIHLAGYANTINLSNSYATVTDGAGFTVFNLGSNSNTNIQGFKSTDQIVFKPAGGINTPQDALSHATSVANGGTQITFGGGTKLTISGVTPTDLTAANFRAA